MSWYLCSFIDHKLPSVGNWENICGEEGYSVIREEMCGDMEAF